MIWSVGRKMREAQAHHRRGEREAGSANTKIQKRRGARVLASEIAAIDAAASNSGERGDSGRRQ
jgi:hypothetical protein